MSFVPYLNQHSVLRPRRWALVCALLLLLAQSALLLHALEHELGHTQDHCAVCLTGQHILAVPTHTTALAALLFAPVLCVSAFILVYVSRSFALAAPRAPPR